MAVFQPDEVVETPRLRLSALTLETLDRLTAWIEAALAPDWRLPDLTAQVEAGYGVLIADNDATPVGTAVVLPGRPLPGAASIPFIAVEASRRYRGLGGEASRRGPDTRALLSG